MLICGHSICLRCAEKLEKTAVLTKAKAQIVCVTCNQTTLVPNGSKNLPQNYALREIVEKHMQEKKADPQQSLDSVVIKSRVCFDHQQELNVFCRTCNEVICVTDWYSVHGSHSCIPLVAILEECKENLKNGAKTLDIASQVISQSQKDVKKTYDNFVKDHKKQQKFVEQTFLELKLQLKTLEKHTLSQVNQFWEPKLDNLKKQMEMMDIRRELEEAAKAARTAETTTDPFVALQLNKNMSEMIERADITKMDLKPCETDPPNLLHLPSSKDILFTVTKNHPC